MKPTPKRRRIIVRPGFTAMLQRQIGRIMLERKLWVLHGRPPIGYEKMSRNATLPVAERSDPC